MMFGKEHSAPHVATVVERVLHSKRWEKDRELPSSESDWKSLTRTQLHAMESYMVGLQQEMNQVGPEDLKETLNANSAFQTHLVVMREYWAVCNEQPTFAKFIQESEINTAFLDALVFAHDFGRFVFNGPLPLLFIDNVSEGLLKHHFPQFPRQYLHSIKWITGEKRMPGKHALPAEKIALMLKAIDTLGKFDATNTLLDPQNFFAPDGLHAGWIKKQVENGRLPFTIRGQRQGDGVVRPVLVTAETYASNDRAVTMRGIEVLESITQVPFAQIREQVAERFSNSPQTR